MSNAFRHCFRAAPGVTFEPRCLSHAGQRLGSGLSIAHNIAHHGGEVSFAEVSRGPAGSPAPRRAWELVRLPACGLLNKAAGTVSPCSAAATGKRPRAPGMAVFARASLLGLQFPGREGSQTAIARAFILSRAKGAGDQELAGSMWVRRPCLKAELRCTAVWNDRCWRTEGRVLLESFLVAGGFCRFKSIFYSLKSPM